MVGVIVEVTVMVTLVIFLMVKLSKVFFALEGVVENFERQRTHRSIVLLHLPRRQVGGSHQVRDLPHSGKGLFIYYVIPDGGDFPIYYNITW